MVSLDNLTVAYQQHPALHHISGDFAAGSLTAVMGPNGSGKSTLLKTIAGLLPHEGRLLATPPRARIAYLPQVTEIDRSFPLSVMDCVLLGTWASAGPWGSVSEAMAQRANTALHALGLAGFEQRSVGTLSSGQMQRVMFARVLVQDAQLVLLDEPFNSIDHKTTNSLLALLGQWHRERRTVIAVLHDEDQVRKYFPNTLLLARELVAWGATAQVLTQAHLLRARAMAEAWNESAQQCDVDQQPLPFAKVAPKMAAAHRGSAW